MRARAPGTRLFMRRATLRDDDMLVCGRCNPPPEQSPDYRGVYFDTSDDMRAHAASMTGVPLRVEHNTKPVGAVLSAW